MRSLRWRQSVYIVMVTHYFIMWYTIIYTIFLGSKQKQSYLPCGTMIFSHSRSSTNTCQEVLYLISNQRYDNIGVYLGLCQPPASFCCRSCLSIQDHLPQSISHHQGGDSEAHRPSHQQRGGGSDWAPPLRHPPDAG